MAARFKPYDPDQMFLLPPSPRDWLEEDDLVYFVSDLVDELDLWAILQPYQAADDRGQPPYNPRMMTKLLLYAYCVGVPSSRRIEQKTYRDVAFRVLAAGQHPDHDTICEFRSRHKAMSYGRMCEAEKRLQEQVRELLEEARRADEEEDRKYGKGKRGDELPEELRFSEGRLRKIREAKAALEREAHQQAVEEGKIDQDGKPVPPERGRRPKHPPGTPRAKDQKNFTDPDSRIMKDSSTKSFVQAYNGQAAVDAEAQVIVAADVPQQANDKEQVEPALEQIAENLGELPAELSADAGYYSEANVEKLKLKGVDPYVPPDKRRHADREAPAPRGRIPKGMTPKDRMRRKLRTKAGRKAYSRRKEVVEPVFGQMKGARRFRQFLLRGLDKVRGEWRLMCLTHNILKLYRSGYRPAGA